MNFYQRFKESSKRWNCLSKSDVLGSFDFMTLTISLESLNINDFKSLANKLSKTDYNAQMHDKKLDFDIYESLKNVYGLLYHECTHYIDTTSTVWGINYIKDMNEAYITNYNAFGTKEDEYFKAKQFYDKAKSLKLPDYYTAITPNINTSRPWQYTITSGRRFDSKGNISEAPIAFMSFFNMGNERIVRSPISIIAILEVSAIAQEISYKHFLSETLPEGIRSVEQNILSNDTVSFIYNHKLTEYTACAHMTANIIGLTDIFKTYKICERISTIVLNFTDNGFNNISFSNTAKKALSIQTDNAFSKEINASIRLKDRGFLFYIILMLMPKKDYDSPKEILDGINSALHEMGLDLYKIIMAARREVENISTDLKKSIFNGISQFSSSAITNFDLKVNSDNGSYRFPLFDLPPVLLGDCEVVPSNPSKDNRLSSFDIESSYNELVAGQIWVERFSEACI